MIARFGLILTITLTLAACQKNTQAQAQVATKSKPATMAKVAVVGQPAPDFTLTSTTGEQVKLSQLKGKVVVLEWFNPDCPFVKVAHNEGKLGERAKAHLAQGGVWFAINSGAEGQQGAGKARNVKARTEYGLNYPILLDPTGVVGHRYAATRTPHMYVIDAQGVLVYAGALDSSGGAGYGDKAVTHYLGDALDAVKKSQAVKTPKTKAWGCSVKYAR